VTYVMTSSHAEPLLTCDVSSPCMTSWTHCVKAWSLQFIKHVERKTSHDAGASCSPVTTQTWCRLLTNHKLIACDPCVFLCFYVRLSFWYSRDGRLSWLWISPILSVVKVRGIVKITQIGATRCQILGLNAPNSISAVLRPGPCWPLGELTALPQTPSCT